MRSAGWLVLALVFLDELLALAAIGYWGWQQDPGWLWVWLLPLVAMQAWFWCASPRARFRHPLGTPLVKLLVFGFATWCLWDSGHPTEAAAFLVFSVAVNCLAQIPAIASLPDEHGPRSVVE